MKPSRTQVRVALVGVALVALALVLVLRGRGSNDAGATAVEADQGPPDPADPARPVLERIERAAPGTAGAPATSALAMAETREHYLDFAVYPPWSRPATPAYAELYDFNQTGPSDQQAIGNLDLTEIHARVALDRVFVEPGRTATITAECWTMKDGVRGSLDFDTVVEVQVATDEPTTPDDQSEPVDLGFRSSAGHLAMGRDGNRTDRRIGRLDVGAFAALAEAPRDARVLVWFQIEGAETKPLALPFMYSTSAPVRVLGVAGEKIVNGSLEVTLDVELAQATPVRLRGALAQAGRLDRPIATYDKWYRPTEAGRQQVTVQFFGRILGEAKLDGPYELYRIHGSAYLAGAQVPEVFWQEDRTFRTRAYRAEQFSLAEWQDPEKDEKLRAYAEVIGSMQRAEVAP